MAQRVRSEPPRRHARPRLNAANLVAKVSGVHGASDVSFGFWPLGNGNVFDEGTLARIGRNEIIPGLTLPPVGDPMLRKPPLHLIEPSE